MSLLRVAAAAALLAATTAQAADPVQWKVADGGNDHYYLFVANDVSWQDALAAAGATSWLGQAGYLATITSAGEDNFAGATAAAGSLAWISASDDGNEGSFTWRAGPEAGQALTYTNWSPGEPNNCCGGENYVHLNWGAGGSWNDHGGPGNAGQVNGYLIEYGGVVPEPATAVLMLGGAALLAGWRRRQQR